MAMAVLFILCAGLIQAQEPETSRSVRDEVRSGKIGQQLITLISFTALPGVSGAKFDVQRGGDDPDYELRKINIGGSWLQPVEGWDVDLLLEGGVGFLKTDENSFGSAVIEDTTILVQTDRKVYSGHVGIGPSFAVTEHLRLAPIARFALSRFNNETGLGALPEDSDTPDDILRLDWEISAATAAAALQARYDRTFGDHRIEGRATYTHAYTNVFDAPASSLEFSGHNDVVTVLGRVTTPTGGHIEGRPLLWNMFATGTVLTGDGRTALGFSRFLEVGMGLDLDLREDNLPVVKALRARASVIIGNSVSGYQVGLSFGF